MKNPIIIAVSLVVLSVFNCKSQESKSVEKLETPKKIETLNTVESYSFSTDSLLLHIKTLSADDFEGRRTGTAGAIKAKEYIINQYKLLNVKPLEAVFEQPFSFTAKGKNYSGVNVLGLIEGSENNNKYIVLSAHYDHEGIRNEKIYNGADDDASGISALFAFAEYFKNNPPKHNVILAAFDGEELGLKGAYYFVANTIIPKEQIKLNLNFDMISRSEDNELFAVGTRYYSQLKPVIDNFKGLGKVNLLIGHEGLDKEDDWTKSGDHAAFHKAKIPFVYFGVADHKDYHEPTDDYENIDPQFYKDAVQTIINVFEQLDTLSL